MTSGHGKWVGLVIGTVLIVLCLMVVLIKPVIDARVFWIIRVVLALAAGLVASGLTGFIVFEHKLPGLTIRAGGPMAVIALVLLLDPGEAAAGAAQPEERKALLREIERLADQIDVVEVDEGGTVRNLSTDELLRRITRVRPGQLRVSARTEDLKSLRTILLDAQRRRQPRLRPVPEIVNPPG